METSNVIGSNTGTMDFPGGDQLRQAIDTAVARTSTQAITDCLRDSLCQLMREGVVELPACVFDAIEGRYARRQLYQSREHGYCVVAMTWGPGQGTSIHDHCGMWCVEGVWQGALEVVQYERLDNQGALYRFQPVASILAGAGSAGSLIPPHEYHAIRNRSADAVAVSLHIYSGEMVHCAIFEPTGQEPCYRRSDRELRLDGIANPAVAHA
jgi:predicted metal-dependent enzyme (double-stranded beta helix superfamily)